jgi:hypothetical protein
MGKLFCKNKLSLKIKICSFDHSWSIASLFLQAYNCFQQTLTRTYQIKSDLIMHLLPSYPLFNAHFVVILDDQNIEFPTPYITNAIMKIKKWPVTMGIDNSALDVPQLKKLH